MPNVTNRYKDVEGKVVNQHEKPPELTFQLMRRFSRLGTTVLCIGGGCGGGVIGMIPGPHTNLIILEPDGEQFSHLVHRIRRLASPSVCNIDMVWLDERVNFGPNQDLPDIKKLCITCGLEVENGALVDVCHQCGCPVHLEPPANLDPCHLSKTEEDPHLFCSDHCQAKNVRLNQ